MGSISGSMERLPMKEEKRRQDCLKMEESCAGKWQANATCGPLAIILRFSLLLANPNEEGKRKL